MIEFILGIAIGFIIPTVFVLVCALSMHITQLSEGPSKSKSSDKENKL